MSRLEKRFSSDKSRSALITLQNYYFSGTCTIGRKLTEYNAYRHVSVGFPPPYLGRGGYEITVYLNEIAAYLMEIESSTCS